MNRKKHSEQEQRELCAKWQASGQTRKGFAKQHGITYKTLSRWLDKFRNKNTSNFVKVGQIPTMITNIKIITPSGLHCHIVLPSEQLTAMLERWIKCN